MRRAAVLFVFAVAVAVVLSASPTAAVSYNITQILAEHPSFSTFNHYLTVTRLSTEINRRRTITVLAVDNAGMADLLAKHLTLPTLRNVLSLHILTDYYGAKKLHQLTGSSALASSVFQSSGAAPGTTGYVNITDHRAGRVTFAAEDTGGAPPSTFVKAVKELPYDLSVIQISSILSSPEAEAPAAAPAPVNLTDVLTQNDCKEFYDLLVTYKVLKTFQDNLDTGLTVFCPVDAAVRDFAPKFKNLSADGKTALLLYHGLPTYYSIQLLKSNNGILSSLASDGKSKGYNYHAQNVGETVTLKTRIITATITATVVDQDPDAVYAIDNVLMPHELFKVPVKSAAADSPADAPEADAPAAHKSPKHKPAAKSKHAPAPDGPEEAPADDEAAADSSDATMTAAAGVWAAAVAVMAMVVAY